jgi:uncharacterized iron-regulated membrane protein
MLRLVLAFVVIQLIGVVVIARVMWRDRARARQDLAPAAEHLSRGVTRALDSAARAKETLTEAARRR